jgi:hypothetical protein
MPKTDMRIYSSDGELLAADMMCIEDLMIP